MRAHPVECVPVGSSLRGLRGGTAVAHANRHGSAVDADHGAIAVGVVADGGDFSDRLAKWDPDAATIAAPADTEKRVRPHDGHTGEVVLIARSSGAEARIRLRQWQAGGRGFGRPRACWFRSSDGWFNLRSPNRCDAARVGLGQRGSIIAGKSADISPSAQCNDEDASRDERPRFRSRRGASRATNRGIMQGGGGRRRLLRTFALRLIQGIADQAHGAFDGRRLRESVPLCGKARMACPRTSSALR